MPKVYYEWTVDHINSDEDIEDADFSDTVEGLRPHTWEGDPLYSVDYGVVRDQEDGTRTWAYVRKGKLQEHFHDAMGEPQTKVPQRFHAELAKYLKARQAEADAKEAAKTDAEKQQEVDNTLTVWGLRSGNLFYSETTVKATLCYRKGENGEEIFAMDPPESWTLTPEARATLVARRDKSRTS